MTGKNAAVNEQHEGERAGRMNARILVLGCPAVGKTTVAREVRKLIDEYPHIHVVDADDAYGMRDADGHYILDIDAIRQASQVPRVFVLFGMGANWKSVAALEWDIIFWMTLDKDQILPRVRTRIQEGKNTYGSKAGQLAAILHCHDYAANMALQIQCVRLDAQLPVNQNAGRIAWNIIRLAEGGEQRDR